jgi:hypothetical protein
MNPQTHQGKNTLPSLARRATGRKTPENGTETRQKFIGGNMSRMSRKRKLEMSFFLNEKGRIEYNRVCRACVHACKQSHKAIVLFCRKFKSKRSQK